MTAQIINGKEVAAEMKRDIALRVNEIKKKFHVTPTLAVILVGNDPASEVYVSNKEKAAHGVGMNSIQFKMAADISEEDLVAKIEELNSDKKVHGILVQLPLPKHIDSKKAIHAIDHRKDVDGFHIANVGKLSIGEVDGKDKAMIPCTPLGCLHLIKSVKGENLSGLKTLIIGSSNIVGRPLARLLMLANCTITVANRSTRDLESECLQSDIIISAAGVPNLVKAEMVKKGAVIIDVGINRVVTTDGKTKLVGDVDFENVKKVASAITPVPGGVGPMTIAYLLQNTLDCCLKQVSNQ
ncbi:MAG: bifunctional methylenetetrahydrofolate dehydrogenase/methenyltetrahydrofolate cyclohydrolase [Proteobacteria bacterium]|nr:bifunctional methylenetetrahydrofolate dehydrogenase/methenyltetrahydrofolate cyclohydrolase [Pseudomonadota bacterium]